MKKNKTEAAEKKYFGNQKQGTSRNDQRWGDF